MNVETGVIYIIITFLLGIFGYAALKKYTTMESSKHNTEKMQEVTQKLHELEVEKEKFSNQAKQWKYKYNSIRREYDLDLDELDIDDDADEASKISDLVGAIFPQLPKKFTKLADREDIQNLIANIATKNPDKIGDFIANFTKPKEDQTNKSPSIPYGI